MNHLVIAAYNRELKWLDDITGADCIVYRKGDVKTYPNEIVLPNYGRDVHTFFKHIHDNYNNLAPITFFAQDFPFDHWENVVDVVNGGEEACKKFACLNINDGYFGFHFNTITIPGVDGGIMWSLSKSFHHGGGGIIRCNPNGTPQHIGVFGKEDLTNYWLELFDSPPKDYYEFVPGGHFAITAEHARIRSKEFYAGVVNYLEKREDYPWAVERLECYMFNPSYKTLL